MVHVRHRKIVIRGLLALVMAVMWFASPAATAVPPQPGSPVVINTQNLYGNDDHVRAIGLGPTDLAEKASRALGSATASAEFQGPWLKFATTSPCGNARPGEPESDNFCNRATVMCAANSDPEGLGPAVILWEATVDQTGSPVAANMQPVPALTWVRAGFTCFPQLVPGATNVLTMAMVLQQFHDTAFAHPTVSVQPVNGRTLVNLRTFYELTWPEVGFQPDEVDTATILGHQVQIRPAMKHAVFVFGDGSTYGPTTSLGGPYPHGDVVHKYTAKTNAQVRVDVTYTGKFSVDGGEWIDVPGEATVQGDPFALEVLEARSQLVTR